MDEAVSPPQGRGSLVSVFLAVFIDLLGFGMVIPLVAIYAKHLTPEDEQGLVIGLLAASFSAMQFLFSPMWGRLSDRIGRRPVLLVGLAGSCVFYAVFGFATVSRSLAWMFVSRIGAGLSGATISTAQAYIADTTTKENRTKGMALIGAAFGLGFTFGPLLAAAALLPGESELSPWPGYVASGLSALAFLYAFVNLPESLSEDSETASRKLFDGHALKVALSIPSIGPLLLTSFIAILSFANFESILAFVLKVDPKLGGFGYDLVDVVLLFALLGFIYAIAQGGVRSLAGRTSEANLATGGATVSFIGFLTLILATRQQSLGLMIAGMLIEATGFAFIPAAINSLISRRSDPAQQGGILSVGQSLGALARILGHWMSFPLFYIAASLPFLVASGLMLLAIGLITYSARRGRDFAETPPEKETAAVS